KTPAGRGGDAVVVADEQDSGRRERPQCGDAAEPGVVEVHQDLSGRPEAVWASGLEPVGVKRLDRLVGAGEVTLDDLLLRDDVRIAARRVLGRREIGRASCRERV